MKTLEDWLDDKLDGMATSPGGSEGAGSFEDMADTLRAEAEADGYNADDLLEICGGDIAAFLRDRHNSLTG